jgi:aspartyl/glutamyl-tRNA(Asn/Gln) amidotransferase C subunit
MAGLIISPRNAAKIGSVIYCFENVTSGGIGTMPENKEEITPEVFNHLVELAALALNENEADYLRSELNKQLSAVHELEAIQLDADTPPASHGVPYPPERKPNLRDDVWHPCLESEQITAQAPQFEDGYIIVPDIPHTSLE